MSYMNTRAIRETCDFIVREWADAAVRKNTSTFAICEQSLLMTSGAFCKKFGVHPYMKRALKNQDALEMARSQMRSYCFR
jgi:hypothetical protein